MVIEESLWGDEFNIEVPDKKEKIKKIIDKIAKPKNVTAADNVVKQVKSKTLSLEDRLALIEENVFKIFQIM